MLPNDDLARWGEPPTDDKELALANRLADALEAERGVGGSGQDRFLGAAADVRSDGEALVETGSRIDRMIDTVLERAGVFLEPAVGAIDLCLRVLRDAGGGRFVTIASTHPVPVALRDLRRVPEDADRVVLRTGDRVRVEVECSRAGYLTVLNVGPQGALHLLHPAASEAPRRTDAHVPVPIADVQLTPPAGKERLWAVWSRDPLGGDLSRLVRPGAQLRDMQRVQDAVSALRPEDWHAVVLELDHQAAPV